MSKICFEVPVVREVDVLVIGGGCAGVAAAVCAARHGAKTMIVDMNGYLGGMATAGLVGPFMTCYDPKEERQVIKGFFEEFVQRMIKDGGAIHPSECAKGSSYAGYRVAGHANCTPFSPESFKKVAEDMCAEQDVEILYHAVFVDAHMNEAGDAIEGAIFGTKAGLIEIKAKQFIDCSGDGDVAFKSGVPCQYGDENGKTQPCSLFFTIKGVDKEKMEAIRTETGDFKSIFFQDAVEAEMEAGRYDIPRNKVALYESSDGTFRVNMSRMNMEDGCDPFDVTKASITGRHQVPKIMDLLKRIVPGCENIELVESASLLGVRETRRIVGEYVLTGDDVKDKRRFEDNIFLAGNSVDMHGGKNVRYEPASGEAYGVPYRILVPKKVGNLFVAGRASSMDRMALAAIRVMPPVFAMGQAAGTAAALCVRDNTAPADVNIAELQKLLVADGAVLD